MAHHRSHHFLPRNASDPDFDRQLSLWASEAQREITEVVEATRETIASSKALISDVDRLLALR